MEQVENLSRAHVYRIGTCKRTCRLLGRDGYVWFFPCVLQLEKTDRNKQFYAADKPIDDGWLGGDEVHKLCKGQSKESTCWTPNAVWGFQN